MKKALRHFLIGVMAKFRFKATEPILVATTDKKFSADFQYWRGLQFPTTIKEYGAVTSVAFQPTKPNLFAVCASSRVELYDPESNELVKTFSRFHDVAYGASFRSDGKLLVAGNEDKNIRLFDVENRVPLRIFKGHTRPVHVTKFCNDKKHIFSAADDATVKMWDVATEEKVNEFRDHEDYIRCGYVARNSDNVLVTGSYDHTVRMFDTRTNQCSMTVNHGNPVESVLLFPSGSIMLSAGGNAIKVWDVLQGGKLLATVRHHHKTITCMCFNHDCTRLLSGGLDRHVKIYDIATYSVVHNIDYPGSILSMDVSHDDKTLVVGMADKMLSIRHRKQAHGDVEVPEERLSERKKKRLRPRFMAGQSFIPNECDLVITRDQKESLTKYDTYFKRFEHGKALEAVLKPSVCNNTPSITVAVMQELIRRETIRAAVAGGGDKKLRVLMRFITRNISNISFAPILIEVAEVIVDTYSETFEEMSVDVKHSFHRLRDVIRKETILHTEMNKLLGCMDIIVRSNSQSLQTSQNTLLNALPTAASN